MGLVAAVLVAPVVLAVLAVLAVVALVALVVVAILLEALVYQGTGLVVAEAADSELVDELEQQVEED